MKDFYILISSLIKSKILFNKYIFFVLFKESILISYHTLSISQTKLVSKISFEFLSYKLLL